MKWIPRQAACPHCQTVYRYADAGSLLWKKQAQCYHCKKTFTVSRRGFIALALETALLYALLNAIMLNAVRGVSLLGLFIVNIFPALAAVFLLPAYIKLK